MAVLEGVGMTNVHLMMGARRSEGKLDTGVGSVLVIRPD